MNPQALELNEILQKENPVVFELLSERGKKIFFPKKGILGQTADAKGKEINATIGAAIEDDGSPMRLKSLEELINLPPASTFPYAPSFGRPDIRAKWKSMIYEKNPVLDKNTEISLPIVTNALTNGLSIVSYLFLDDGEKMILPDLFWGNYNLIFTNAYGVKLDTFKFFNGDSMDLNAFENKLNEGTPGKKVLLLNFPNNPSGYTPTVDEVKSIVEIIKSSAEKGNKLVVVLDDAYFGLVYEDGIEKYSVFSYLANLHENVLAVKVDGPTKEDYVWGFRTGFISYGIKNGNAALLDALAAKTAGAVRGNISNAANVSQSLLLKAYESPSYWDEKKQKYAILQGRYKEVKRVLGNGKYDKHYKALPFNSGYFMCIKLQEGLNGEKIRQILLNDYSTGVIHMKGLFRIAFSSVAEKDIEKLFENIYAACEDSLES